MPPPFLFPAVLSSKVKGRGIPIGVTAALGHSFGGEDERLHLLDLDPSRFGFGSRGNPQGQDPLFQIRVDLLAVCGRG